MKTRNRKNRLKTRLLSVASTLLGMTVYADMSSATNTGISGINQLDNAVRMVYSREIEFKAMPVMRFRQFATYKQDLDKQPGDTISMLTYDNLVMGGPLKEGVRMKTQSLKNSMKQIKVGERGNAVAVTELLLQTSFDDIMATASTLLGRDMALVLDCELRDAALSGTNVIYARDSATKATIDAREDLTAKCIMQVSTIKDAIEILATNNAPKWNGQDWVCFVHPHQSRGLRDDPAWINASNYGAPELLFLGEIGKIDDTRFIETTLMCNGAVADTEPSYVEELDSSVSANNLQVDVYQSVIFGEAYYGYAEALPVELRSSGVTDFGREHGLAWYAIWGTGILHNEHGVIIETA